MWGGRGRRHQPTVPAVEGAERSGKRGQEEAPHGQSCGPGASASGDVKGRPFDTLLSITPLPLSESGTQALANVSLSLPSQ